jgi:hypothetical protein
MGAEGGVTTAARSAVAAGSEKAAASVSWQRPNLLRGLRAEAPPARTNAIAQVA